MEGGGQATVGLRPFWRRQDTEHRHGHTRDARTCLTSWMSVRRFPAHWIVLATVYCSAVQCRGGHVFVN